MLVYDSLIEQAGIRQMPVTKMRGILREYLQILILKEVCRTEAGRKLYFTGGTYLRLAHDLKRFSKDLDFNSYKLTKKEFEQLLKMLINELIKKGIQSRVRFVHWGNVYSAKLVFPDVEGRYNIISRYSKKEGIIIKLETNNLKKEISTETQVISGFGEIYPCVCTNKSILFADKIDAVLKKNRGRHIYDVIFMLSNNYSIDKKTLTNLGIKENPLKVILGRINSYSRKELLKQAEVLRPFLFDEADADLIADAHSVIPPILEKYKGAIK